MREVLEFIKENSIDLSEMGVNNFAMLKKDTLKLLDMLQENDVLVYGGDFIEKKNGTLNYNYTNWSTNEKDIKHNVTYAKDFIEKYAKDDTYIEIVTDVDLYRLLNR